MAAFLYVNKARRLAFCSNPHRIKLCSDHIRAFQLVARNKGFALGRMPVPAGSKDPGGHFMPGTASELDDQELAYGNAVSSTRVAPHRLHTDARKLEDSLRSQEELATENAALHQQLNRPSTLPALSIVYSHSAYAATALSTGWHWSVTRLA